MSAGSRLRATALADLTGSAGTVALWLVRVRRRYQQRLLGGDGQAGVSTVELVLLVPLVVLLTFLPVQAGLIWHARQVMVAAAQEGARAAREADLTAGQAQGAGSQQALAFVSGVGGRAVSGAAVSVQRSDAQVQVRVSGQAMAILPMLAVTVHGDAVSPVERFVAP